MVLYFLVPSLVLGIPRPKPPQKWQTPKTPLTIPFKFLSQFGVNLHSNSGLNLTRKLGVGVISKCRRGYLGKVSGEIEGDSWGGFLVTTLKVVVGCESRGRDEYELSALWC